MPRALLSVYDKTGLIEFAQGLHAFGYELLASGSTAASLREHNIPVKEISDYTQSPEMLGGRVKTLHPAVHGGILARDTPADHQELLDKHWDYIDLVAVNLYPFEETIAKPNVTLNEAIEQIDIGGVALIRAAAKNFQRVTLVCDPQDYSHLLAEIEKHQKPTLETRQQLAVKGFTQTSLYDVAIQNYLTSLPSFKTNLETSESAPPKILTLYPVQSLRYGENPHQSAKLYSTTKNSGPLGGEVLQGKALSYNNLLDLDAAFRAVSSFKEPAVCIVKHLSPCGIASAKILSQAYLSALSCDPISAFGGIIAVNRCLDESTVESFGNLFIECIAAPDFSPQALALLSKRTNCRVLKLPAFPQKNPMEYRSIHQGMLCQELDIGDPSNITPEQWKIITQKKPTESEMRDLAFAWLACQHVKSNAIVFAKHQATIGIGGGQPNRIDCVRMAAQRAGEKSHLAVMASDAFFPFPDAVLEAAKHGISAIIQPGGSVKDTEVIEAANSVNIAMVMTGVRHFRH